MQASKNEHFPLSCPESRTGGSAAPPEGAQLWGAPAGPEDGRVSTACPAQTQQPVREEWRHPAVWLRHLGSTVRCTFVRVTTPILTIEEPPAHPCVYSGIKTWDQFKSDTSCHFSRTFTLFASYDWGGVMVTGLLGVFLARSRDRLKTLNWRLGEFSSTEL